MTVRRPCSAVALAAGALLMLLAPPLVPRASADPISSCTTTHGTIVAVDFSHWGGSIVRGCGVSAGTGYELLHDGGFTTAGTQHDGPAFICRIGTAGFHAGTQYPTPQQDSCVLTPPASAQWSYWLAPAGQNTWSYGQLGAMSDTPKPGEVELWQFGSTNVAGTTGRPSVSPAQLRASDPSPPSSPRTSATTIPSHHRSSATGRTSTTSGTASSSGSAARSSSTTGGDVTGSSGSSHSGSDAALPGTGGGSSAAIVDASPSNVADASSKGSGSPVAVIVTIGIAAVLAAGAAWTIWRRRQAESSP